MSKIKDIYHFKEDGKEGILMNFENFFDFIKDRLTPGDKTLHRHNVLREFKGHREGIRELSNGKAVTATSVTRFIFNHFEDYKICHDIGVEIVNGYFDNKTKEFTKTILGLYKSVSETEFYGCLLSAVMPDDIPSLHTEYKSMFIDNEWDKIAMFENHFSNYKYCSNEDFETTLKRKWELFEYLKTIHGICQIWSHNTKTTIKRRLSRQKSFELSQNIEVHGQQSHFPVVIESQLLKSIDLMWPECISNVVCVDTMVSRSENALTLLLFCQDFSLHNDVTNHAARFLNGRHNVNVSRVIYLSEEITDQYTQANNDIARFHLRDDILMGKLKDVVMHIDIPLYQTVPTIQVDKCLNCHATNLPKPLHIQNFLVLQEWYFDTPLDVQIILETFINKDSVRKSPESDKLVKSKLDRLYGVYDSMLNTFNKRYIGVLQQANTDELAMHYRSINTVFSITSSSGISSSLVQAERTIKERTTNDLCYYNTYLKRYPLSYETVKGVECKMINLQECHIILMMDNLVRLTTKSDPDPGENRTGQVCTLPLTIQGLPKDNVETRLWHLEGCTMSNCMCKHSTTLTKEDFDSALVVLTKEEQGIWNKFYKVMTWGSPEMWNKIKESFMSVKLNSEQTQSIEDSEIEDHFGDLPVEIIDETQNTTDIDFEDKETSQIQNVSTINMSYYPIPEEEINEETEENLESLLETARLFSHTTEILQDELIVNQHDLSGFDEISYFDSNLDESGLESSFENMSLDAENSNTLGSDTETPTEKQNILHMFGLHKYEVPPLLCRHPPPATGRDDDIFKLKEIMDDILVKTGRINLSPIGAERILFGPDNKIGANLLEVIKESKYQHFLPEFPLLHLRKSKINMLFSAYKDAGLLHLLMFMCDEDKKDWSKLITMEHIDVATRYVRRLALSLHMAFMCKFLHCLEENEAREVITMIDSGKHVEASNIWNERYLEFMDVGITQNCTFALHAEMMNHCDEIVAVYMSERLGGNDGYDLLLSAVKKSLPFSFLNGAASYAPYCTRLLLEHYSAGHFHQCLKKTLYSTPIGNSSTNFASDSKREMDHQDALRGFRSGSSMSSVVGRMSLIDSFNSTHQLRRKINTVDLIKNMIEWKISEVDLRHIVPTATLILRRNALSLEESDFPENVYALEPIVLSPCLLDFATEDIGKYLIKRYLANNNLLGMTSDDVPDIKKQKGPSSLLNRASRSKGVTIKRTAEKVSMQKKTNLQIIEEKRKALVKREMQRVNLLSSEMNMCQALVKPDCTKPKVMKSKGIQQALLEVFEELQYNENPIAINLKSVPKVVSDKVEFITVEFAGVKFKTKVASGTQYIKYVQNAVIKPILKQFPFARRIVVCEEKYSFTPDTFKAATHQQRASKTKSGISHLRSSDELIDKDKFRKEDLITTREGKMLISTYLARHASSLELNADIILDIDSEFNMKEMTCIHNQDCKCMYFSIPLRCIFSKQNTRPLIEDISDVHQRKGEAEMAQLDWLCNTKAELSDDKAACSILTSGDIDAVPIHLFALSDMWPKADEKHQQPVFVLLQKPNKKIDVYNITSMIEILQHHFKDDDIAKKISIILCMGGNDFIPKFYGISHQKMLSLYLKNDFFRGNLLKKNDIGKYQLDVQSFKTFIKTLYCPKAMDISSSFEDVRRATIFTQKKQSKATELVYSKELRCGQLWMPPETALDRVAEIINLQIDYLYTAGHPMDGLPDFLGKDCLKQNESGEITYHFGPDSKGNISEIIGRKRLMVDTPQKGARRKRIAASTPIKSKKQSQ